MVRLALLWALLGMLAGVLVSPEASAMGWLRAESEHFVLYTNFADGPTRAYLRELEAYNYLIGLVLGADPKSAANRTKFTIYSFADHDLLKTVRPAFGKEIDGVYLHCVEGAEAFSYRPPVSTDREQDQGLITLQHEYAHHVMFSHMRQFYPPWYMEGFAEYLSTVTLRQGAFIVGSPYRDRLLTLMSNDSWVDFRVLLDPVKFSESSSRRHLDIYHFYAQSWLLTHYMLADTQRIQSFKDYFERIGRGEDAVTSFESATGIPVSQLTGRLQEYIRKMSALTIRVPEIPESSLQVTSLPDERSEYLLRAAVLRTCPEPDYGRKLLGELRAMAARHDKDNAFRLEVDRAELLFGDLVGARADLEKLAAEGEQSFDQHYLLGRTFYAAAQKDVAHRESWLSQAAGEFLAAYQLDKLDPPNLYFLSRSLDDGVGRPTSDAANAAFSAAVLAPSVLAYAFQAASAEYRAGEPYKAIRALQPFASDPHNPKRAATVVGLIASIKNRSTLLDWRELLESGVYGP